MSYTEQLVRNFVMRDDERKLVPSEITSLCCNYYGYRLCCIALSKHKKLPTSAVYLNVIEYENINKHETKTKTKMWSCLMCSYRNKQSNERCFICHYKKDTKYAPGAIRPNSKYWQYPCIYIDKHENGSFNDLTKEYRLNEIIDVDTDINITEALYCAIILGHISCFKYLSPTANYPKLNMYAPLFMAAKCDQISIMKILLNSGLNEMDPNQLSGNPDTKLLSPLMTACAFNSVAAANLLINLPNIQINAKAIYVNHIRDGSTAFNIACNNGNIECVKLLLTHKKVLIDQARTDERTPLWLASCRGHLEIVQLLLNHSNSPKVNIDKQDEKGFNPLFVASQNGHTEVVKLLLKNNADVTVKCERHHLSLWIASLRGRCETVKVLVKHPNIDINDQDESGVSALWAACQNGHDEVVKVLLDPLNLHQNLDNDENKQEVDIEAVAIYQSVVYDNQQLLLREKPKKIVGADPNLAKNDRCTPLWIASARGELECVRLLLRYGADINIKDDRGATPLFVACQNGKAAVVDLLLTIHDINANQERESDGTTPIMMAAHNNHIAIIHSLLKKGAQITKLNNSGLSVIGCAAMQGHLAVIILLDESLRKCQNVCDKDVVAFMDSADKENGWTALHLACMGGHDDVAKYLINIVKVDISKRDYELKNALEHAWQNGHQSLVSWLSVEAHMDIV